VFVFVSTSCPVANSYTSELNRPAADLPQDVKLFGIVSDPFVTRGEARKHFDEYHPVFPVLFDGSGLLADVLEPTHVPEAFVIDHDGHMVYRGAIDNAYESIGRRRANVELPSIRISVTHAHRHWICRPSGPESRHCKPAGFGSSILFRRHQKLFS
jgi:hypothetical protein